MNRYAILVSVIILAGCAGAEPTPCVDADADGYGDGCTLGLDCRDDDPAIHPGAPEACEGADSDCDGTIDEGCGCVDGQVEACGSDVGECRAGTATCAGGALGACVGAIEAAVEICDGGADEDCDGTIDEDCACTTGAERPCGSDVGECSAGVQRCAAGSWSACEGGVGPSLEACDGALDEDCDGVADDGCDCVDGATRACGSDVGACSAGTQTCEGGAWRACMGAIGPAPEICEGREDESCDGAVDEGCDCTDGATRACGSDTGACSAGTQTCAAGTWGLCDGAIDPVAEIGIDQLLKRAPPFAVRRGEAVIVDQRMKAVAPPVPDVPNEGTLMEQLTVLCEEPVAQPVVQRLAWAARVCEQSRQFCRRPLPAEGFRQDNREPLLGRHLPLKSRETYNTIRVREFLQSIRTQYGEGGQIKAMFARPVES